MTVPPSSFPLPERQRVTGHWDFARAVDFPTALGTPWLAVFDGTTRPYYSATAGNALYLLSNDGTTTAYYGHGQADPDTRVIGAVTAGQTIGHVGMTGLTTGPHLHFAITNDRVVTYQGGGTIDPADYFSGAVSAPAVSQTIADVAGVPEAAPDPIPAPARTPSNSADPAPTIAPAPATALENAVTTVTQTLPAPVRPYAPLIGLGLAAVVLVALLDD